MTELHNTVQGQRSAVIYIIRHGRTEANRQYILQSRVDNPLSEEGILQAERARDWFSEEGISISAIYSSPLIRALKTGQIVAGDLVPVTLDDRLLEMDYGPYEGIDLKSPPPEIKNWFGDFVHHPAPEGIESLSSVVGRAGSFLEDLRKKDPSGNILIATHAIAMKGFLEYLTPEAGGRYWSKNIRNCDVYMTRLTPEGYTVPVQVYANR